jgi:hypothetical protein
MRQATYVDAQGYGSHRRQSQQSHDCAKEVLAFKCGGNVTRNAVLDQREDRFANEGKSAEEEDLRANQPSWLDLYGWRGSRDRRRVAKAFFFSLFLLALFGWALIETDGSTPVGRHETNKITTSYYKIAKREWLRGCGSERDVRALQSRAHLSTSVHLNQHPAPAAQLLYKHTPPCSDALQQPLLYFYSAHRTPPNSHRARRMKALLPMLKEGAKTLLADGAFSRYGYKPLASHNDEEMRGGKVRQVRTGLEDRDR